MYILDINPLLVTSFASIFSLSVDCPFILLKVSLLCKSFEVELGPICLFLLLFILPCRNYLRKYCYDLCQRRFCLYSLLSFCWLHVFLKNSFVEVQFGCFLICLFWLLHLSCCASFSLVVGSMGYSLDMVCRLLIAVTAFVSDPGL